MIETEDKLKTLAEAARFDVCGNDVPRPFSGSSLRFVHRATLPGGGCISLFKVLLTNSCVNDCAYCINQVGLDRGPRRSFKPDELARLFMELHDRRLVRGLFLTSGIGHDASQTMESMIKTVGILRSRYEFNGYVHLKILPGASFDCVAEACRLASRVSVNMEAPTPELLAKLSSKKNLTEGIVERMRWVTRLAASDERLVPSGQTTQFVVGAAGETDRDILATTGALYQEMKLRRVYFSAFQPVRGSRLQGIRPASSWRQHRLYQTDWLLRVYGFPLQEVKLALNKEGNLRLNQDPKLAIARSQPWLFPVDVNLAGYGELLRVPGIGPTLAARIVERRREHHIGSFEDLQKLGLTRRATPFIWLKGMSSEERQLSFLPAVEEPEPAPALAEVLA